VQPTAQKNDVLKESNLLECLLHELNSQLDVSVCPRTQLIKKSADLKQMLQEVRVLCIPLITYTLTELGWCADSQQAHDVFRAGASVK